MGDGRHLSTFYASVLKAAEGRPADSVPLEGVYLRSVLTMYTPSHLHGRVLQRIAYVTK